MRQNGPKGSGAAAWRFRKLLSRVKVTEQGITVNGERVYTNDRLKEGDILEVRMEQEQSNDILAQPLPLDIV